MAELLLATLYLVSEAPPDNPKEATAENKSEVVAPEPAKDAPPAAGTALTEAAKAMDAAEKKADVAPAAAVDAPAATTEAKPAGDKTPAAETPRVDPVIVPSPSANTSGMHLQYVAPGVRRQSLLETYKYPLTFVAVAFTLIFLMLRGGVGGGLGGDLASGAPTSAVNGGGGGAGNNASGAMSAQVQQAMTAEADDNEYQPLANRMPASDLTVNAGALNGKPPLLAAHVDAGVNKGGYADERADLDAAETMVATNPDKALAMVDKHDKDYPRGILDPDARIIRIEAFQKKGDDTKALGLADEFLQDYPHSPRAGTVQSIAKQIKDKVGGGGTGTP